MVSREDESGTPSSGQQVTVSITATPVQAPAAGNTVLITAAPVLLTNCTDYTWDVENRLTAVTGGTSFIYDGDGSRVKKTENGETILYVNKYYEKNLTTGIVTTNYYLGGRLIATRENETLQYVHQDSLNSTSVITASDGTQVSSIKYFAFGLTRSGSVSTEQKFTGQRLDSTGLYYYGARYYDPEIGRFISADTIVPDPGNPQSLNRYTYCLNNPLKYIDPSGNVVEIENEDLVVWCFDNYGIINDAVWDTYIEPYIKLQETWETFNIYEGAMADILQNSDITYTISSGTVATGIASAKPTGKTSATITLDLYKIGNRGINATVWAFAHEAMHGAVMDGLYKKGIDFTTTWGSRYEEAVCCQYQALVGKKYGYTGGNWWTYFTGSNDFDCAYRAVRKAQSIDLVKAQDADVSMKPLERSYPYLDDFPNGTERGVVSSLSYQFIINR